MVKSSRISFVANVSFSGEAVVPVLRDGMKPNFRAPSMAANSFFLTGVFEPERDIAHGETQRCNVSVVTGEDNVPLFHAGQVFDLYGKSIKKLGDAIIVEVTDIFDLGE